MKKWLIGIVACLGLSLLVLPGLDSKEAGAGQSAPDFSLQDINGEKHSLSEFKGKYVVLEWVNHGCPFVKKHYGSGNMQGLQQEMKDKGVVWLSICSSAKGKQGSNSPQEWKQLAAEKEMKSSYILLDPSGKVGKMYGAKTTPHMFVIDPKGLLIYKGAIDDKPTTDLEDVKGAKNYVRSVLDDSMGAKKLQPFSTQSYGCSVKYGKGE